MNAPNRSDRRKAARVQKVSPAASFKKNKNPVVELPGGNVIRVKRPGMTAFLEAGFLPDPLADIVRRQIAGGGDAKKVLAEDMFKKAVSGDISILKTMMRTVDRIAAYCVVEPKVCWHEREVQRHENPEVVDYEVIPDSERDPEVVYTDEMEDEDKMFIFQFAVGGSSDLTRFRDESARVMGDVPTGEGVVEAP